MWLRGLSIGKRCLTSLRLEVTVESRGFEEVEALGYFVDTQVAMAQEYFGLGDGSTCEPLHHGLASLPTNDVAQMIGRDVQAFGIERDAALSRAVFVEESDELLG